MQETSGLRFYSLGIVAVDKLPDDYYIQVTPMESLPLAEGNLKDAISSLNHSLPDAQGVVTTVSISTKMTIPAKWSGLFFDNRATAPDVCQGEKVILTKFGDAEQIYWSTAEFNPQQRKKETVCYVFSNEPKPSNHNEVTKDNSYWFEVDTRGKTITLHSSANDGEVTEYDIVIDTAAGTLSVVDGLGNTVILDSGAGTLVGNINTEVTITVPNMILNSNVKINGTLEVSDAVTLDSTLTVSDMSTLNGGIIGG